ncbi:MAG: sigma-70 family RNA polymerase sigma factor [Pyrinomonadaceae bacterium]
MENLLIVYDFNLVFQHFIQSREMQSYINFCNRFYEKQESPLILHLISRQELPKINEHVKNAYFNAYQILQEPFESMEVVFEVLYRIEKSPYEPRNFAAYLMVSVRNEARKRSIRAKKYNHISTDDFQGMINLITFENPERKFLSDEISSMVNQIVNELIPELREIVELHYFEDLSVKEIANLRGITVPSVNYRIRKASQIMRPKFIELL